MWRDAGVAAALVAAVGFLLVGPRGRWWPWRRRPRLRPRLACECRGCPQPAAHFVWSDEAQRKVGFCEWDYRRFMAATTNRATRRAWKRSTRRKGAQR